MIRLSSKGLLKIYLFIILYSSILKLVLGRWGTLVSDVATIIMGFYCVYSNGKFIISCKKEVKTIFVAILFVQIIAIMEMFNPNITNLLYSLIEYRKSYFQMVSIAVVYWLVRKSEIDAVEILKYLGNISIPIMLYGIKQYFWWGEIDNKLIEMNDANFASLSFAGHIRSVSIFSGPFHYGLFCVLLFSIFVFLMVKDSKKYIIAVLLSIGSVVCSITRTNIVCLIIAGGIWYLMFMKNDAKKKNAMMKIISIIVCVLMFVALVTGFFDNSFVDNDSSFGVMMNSLSDVEGDTRFTGRIESWNMASCAIVAHPFLGNGVGSAGDTMKTHYISRIYVTPHNMFLKICMETGFLGLIAYMYVFLKSAKKVVRTHKKDYVFRSLFYTLLSSVFINGLVGSTIGAFPSMSLLWIVIGILLAKENYNSSLSEG